MSLDRRQMLMTAAAGMAFAAHSAAAATPAQTTAISDPRLAELFDQFSEEMIAESPRGQPGLGSTTVRALRSSSNWMTRQSQVERRALRLTQTARRACLPFPATC